MEEKSGIGTTEAKAKEEESIERAGQKLQGKLRGVGEVDEEEEKERAEGEI